MGKASFVNESNRKGSLFLGSKSNKGKGHVDYKIHLKNITKSQEGGPTKTSAETHANTIKLNQVWFHEEPVTFMECSLL